MLRNNVKEGVNSGLGKRYGSKKGFLLTNYYRLMYFFGVYNQYYKVDWKSIERVIFICKGNICRSAYADVIAKSMNLEVASCGVHARLNKPANQSAIKAAEIKGIDLTQHKTTPLNSMEFKPTDLVIAMEPWQADHVKREQKGKCSVTLLGLWGEPKLPYIHDPYGLSAEYFDFCFSYIEKAVGNINQLIKCKQAE